MLGRLSVGIPDAQNLDERELRKMFDEIDTSGDGSLDPEELKQVFDKICGDVDQQVIDNLVFLADDDGNGTLEFDEFSQIFSVLKQMSAKR